MNEDYVKFDYMSEEEQAWEQYVADLDRDLETMTVSQIAEEIVAGSYFEYTGKDDVVVFHAPEHYIAANPDQTFVLNRSDCDHFKRAAARIPAETRDAFLMEVMEILMEQDCYLHCLEALDEADAGILQWAEEAGLSEKMKAWRKAAGEGIFTDASGREAARVVYGVNGDLKVMKDGVETVREVIWDIDSNLQSAMAYRWFGGLGANALSPSEMTDEMKFYFGWKVQLADIEKMQDQNGAALKSMDLSPYEAHISRVTIDCNKAAFGANVWFREGKDLHDWVRDTIDEMLKRGLLVMADHCLGMAIAVVEMRPELARREQLLAEWRDWFMTMDCGQFSLSGGRNLGELHFYRAGNGVMIYRAELSRKGRWEEIPRED